MSADQTPAPYMDFTHPDYHSLPRSTTPQGVQYPVGMSPQKAAKILDKAGRAGIVWGKGVAKGRGKSGGKGRGKGKGKAAATPIKK